MSANERATDRFHLRARLRELIAALDRRVPHPARHAEAAIAADAAALKREAEARIVVLDGEETATVRRDTARG
jgi:hypothetical protein